MTANRTAAARRASRAMRENPGHPVYAWLDGAGKTVPWLAGVLGVQARTIAYWIAGQQRRHGREYPNRAPEWARKRIAELSGGKVAPDDWGGIVPTTRGKP